MGRQNIKGKKIRENRKQKNVEDDNFEMQGRAGDEIRVKLIPINVFGKGFLVNVFLIDVLPKKHPQVDMSVDDLEIPDRISQ